MRNCLSILLKREGCHLMVDSSRHVLCILQRSKRCFFSLTEIPFTHSDLATVWTNLDWFYCFWIFLRGFSVVTHSFVLCQIGQRKQTVEIHSLLDPHVPLCTVAISLVGICNPNMSSPNGFYDLFAWWLMGMGGHRLMQNVMLKSWEIRFKPEAQICYLKDFMFCIKYLLSSFVLIDMLLFLEVVVQTVILFAEITIVIKVLYVCHGDLFCHAYSR